MRGVEESILIPAKLPLKTIGFGCFLTSSLIVEANVLGREIVIFISSGKVGKWKMSINEHKHKQKSL
jgi:hypothetical protein